ncbi:hypothetical protein AB6O49_14340 [Streptomyces sp. SBR177]
MCETTFRLAVVSAFRAGLPLRLLCAGSTQSTIQASTSEVGEEVTVGSEV